MDVDIKRRDINQIELNVCGKFLKKETRKTNKKIRKILKSISEAPAIKLVLRNSTTERNLGF